MPAGQESGPKVVHYFRTRSGALASDDQIAPFFLCSSSRSVERLLRRVQRRHKGREIVLVEVSPRSFEQILREVGHG